MAHFCIVSIFNNARNVKHPSERGILHPGKVHQVKQSFDGVAGLEEGGIDLL